MRTALAIRDGQKCEVAFQLLRSTWHVDSGVLIAGDPRFFTPGDIFVLETKSGVTADLVVDKVRPNCGEALVAFSNA